MNIPEQDEEQNEDIAVLYGELLHAVGPTSSNETAHYVALRYIKESARAHKHYQD